MTMASSLVVSALALAPALSSSQQIVGWSPLNAFFALGQSVALVEISKLHRIAGVPVLETRVVRCVRGPWPGNSLFLTTDSLGDDPSEGQRWLVLLGSERHISGTRAFWRKLDRMLDGKPLHSSFQWFRVQELYGTPHVVPIIEAIPEMAPAEEDEEEEETLVRPLGRPRIHRLSPD